MRFTVTWHPSAERELADIWLRSTDRKGEEFYGDRILVVLPLAVTYAVSEPDRSVQILHVWHQ